MLGAALAALLGALLLQTEQGQQGHVDRGHSTATTVRNGCSNGRHDLQPGGSGGVE